MSSKHIKTEWFKTQARMGLNSYITSHADGIYLVSADGKTEIKKSTLEKLIQKKLVVKKGEVYIASWVFNSQAVQTTVAAS